MSANILLFEPNGRREQPIAPLPVLADIPDAVRRRAEDILKAVCAKALGRCDKYARSVDFWNWKQHLDAAVTAALGKHCQLLIQAASISDAKVKAQRDAEREAERIIRDGRSKMATQLKRARASLRQSTREMLDLETRIKETAKAAARYAACHNYPVAPAPTIVPSATGKGLPDSSGVYFVWRDDRIVYVGQSVRLSSRCRLRTHHAISLGDLLSFIELPESSLNFAESFYIGTLLPPRNFGRMNKLK